MLFPLARDTVERVDKGHWCQPKLVYKVGKVAEAKEWEGCYFKWNSKGVRTILERCMRNGVHRRDVYNAHLVPDNKHDGSP